VDLALADAPLVDDQEHNTLLRLSRRDDTQAMVTLG